MYKVLNLQDCYVLYVMTVQSFAIATTAVMKERQLMLAIAPG